MAASSATAKMKLYIGFGRFSPWIFEPSHSKSVGQNTIMINGVPEPAKNKNGVESTTSPDASKETLFLNQRFSRSINKKPSIKPIIILGSLIAKAVKPKIIIENFCNTR